MLVAVWIDANKKMDGGEKRKRENAEGERCPFMWRWCGGAVVNRSHGPTSKRGCE